MNDSFPWEDLLDYIQDGKVVPVVGHELIEAEYQGRRVSLQRLLAERLAEREKLEVQWTRHFELNDAVCAYLANPQARLVGLYDRIASFLRSMSPPFPVPDGLIRLAGIGRLDLFVSLTFDSLLARAIDQVRFGGRTETREIEFSLNQSTAAQAEALRVRPGDAPVVFNLFGRAASKSDFALHDEDALEFIHRLVSGDVAPPEWLLSELRNRHLLIIGVHLADWLERFLLRAATRDRMRLAQRAYFIAGENATPAGTLTQFLHRFGRETSISASRAPPTNSPVSCSGGGRASPGGRRDGDGAALAGERAGKHLHQLRARESRGRRAASHGDRLRSAAMHGSTGRSSARAISGNGRFFPRSSARCVCSCR